MDFKRFYLRNIADREAKTSIVFLKIAPKEQR